MANSSRDIQLIELKDMIAQLNMTIKTLNETIARQQTENDNLKAELAWFRKKYFGSSSEKSNCDKEEETDSGGTVQSAHMKQTRDRNARDDYVRMI